MEPLRNEDGQTLKQFLDAYDENRWRRRPSCTVDMILMTVSGGRLKLLLVKRKNHPYLGDWATPGGFIDFEEDMEAAVRRELAEETHITKYTYFRQLYTFGAADRDPRTRVITTDYLSLTPPGNIRRTKAGDDAADAAWFDISKRTLSADENGRVSLLVLDCPEKNVHMEYRIRDKARHNYIETRSALVAQSNARLAADHIKAINMAMDLVQHRAASTGILFNLVDEEFTLRQIQTAYEAVKGEKVDTGNFRRDIRRMLKATGRTQKSGGKQARLYRFNPMYRYLQENL